MIRLTEDGIWQRDPLPSKKARELGERSLKVTQEDKEVSDIQKMFHPSCVSPLPYRRSEKKESY